MARNQTRKFSNLLLALGIIDVEKGPKVNDDIQMVYVMDDLRDLIAQVRRPTYVMTEVSPTNVARRGIVELSAPPDAAVLIKYFRNDSSVNQIVWGVNQASIITADQATVFPDVSLGGASRSFIQEGTGAGFGPVRLLPDAELASNFPVLIIPPGSIIEWGVSALNASCDITVAWLEIPVPAITE